MVLSNQCIQKAVEEAAAFFKDSRISEKDQMRLRLLIEHALLAYQAALGESAEFEMFLRKQGTRKRVVLRIRGDKIDPFENVPENDGFPSTVYLNNLFALGTARAYWKYVGGCNVIVANALKGEKGFRIPGGAVTIAAVLGFAAALVTKSLPEPARLFLVDGFSAPLLSKLLGLIILVTGPVIFFSVLSGICALDDLSTVNKLGTRVIKRFFIISSIMIVFAMASCFVFFPGLSADAKGAFDPATIAQLLFDLIPQDLFSPFAEGKMIQVIILAALAGAAVMILGDRVPRTREFIAEANQLMFQIMDLVAKIIPLAVFLSIYKAVAANTLSDILSVWKVIAANWMMIPFTALMLLWVTMRRKVSPREFLQKVMPVFNIAFLSGSTTLSMSRNYEVCKEDLQIDKKLCDFYIPLSFAMFSPSTIFPLVVAAFYSSEHYGTPISPFQLLIVYILVAQLSVASPKVPGGIMATFTILLNQLGMPLDAVGLLMVANVFCVNIQSALAMVIRDLDLVDLSAKPGI